MPATVTLSSTTLLQNVDGGARSVKLESTSGVLPGKRLYCEGELMTVQSLGVGTNVNVTRGQDGTAGVPHSSTATVYIGAADHFYSKDPSGRPTAAVPVSPYINAINGTIWFAQGDVLPTGESYRWWQRVDTTYGVGPLGVRTQELDPTSGT